MSEQTFIVRLPFAGWYEVEVEASGREDAITKAFDVDSEITRGGGADWEIEAMREISRGNFLYVSQNEVMVMDEDGNELVES